MKIFIIFIVFLYSPLSVIFAQSSDLHKNDLKFNLDMDKLLKGEGLSIDYIGYERSIGKNNSLSIFLGYDFNSSKFTTQSNSRLTNTQKVKIRIDYRQYMENDILLKGFYFFSSFRENFSITSTDKERNNEIGAFIGIGYQYIINKFVLDININKGYVYKSLTNNNLKYNSSETSAIIFSVFLGYNF